MVFARRGGDQRQGVRVVEFRVTRDPETRQACESGPPVGRERVPELHRAAVRPGQVNPDRFDPDRFDAHRFDGGLGRGVGVPQAAGEDGIARRVEAGEVVTHPAGELCSQLVVRPTLPDRIDDAREFLNGERTVRVREVMGLEMGRGRQHHIGEPRGIGHHLLVHDGEQVFPRESGEHRGLMRIGGREVGSLDEQHPNRRAEVGVAQRSPERVHVEEAGLAPVRRGVGLTSIPGDRRRLPETRQDPGAGDAELAGEHRETHDRGAARIRRCDCARVPIRGAPTPAGSCRASWPAR